MKYALGNVDEAGVTGYLGEGKGLVEVDAEDGEAGGDELPEVDEGLHFGELEGGVGLGEVVYLLQLQPTAGFGMSERGEYKNKTDVFGEGLPVRAMEELGPVFDGHYGVPGVDEVEVILRVQPGGFDIVDHEFYVRWYPGRLDGREVDAENGC